MRASLALLCAALSMPAWCTPVSVTLVPSGDASAEGTLVIFDPKDFTPAATHDEVNIDQVQRQFVPRISIIRTGTSVHFPNSDNVRHQVYSFSPAKTFTLKLYSGQPSSPVVFDKPGLVVLGCNIHDRMAAFVGIVDSPYFGKAPASGTLSVDLPTGHYRVRVWNPHLTAAVAAQELTVQASPVTLRVPLGIDPAAPAVAAWPE